MPLPKQGHFNTYADYYQWDDGNCYELIEGEPYMMSPAPSTTHQRISSRLHREISLFLKGKTCEAFYAPFDVRLFGLGDDDTTVVQPDLSVICDHSKIDDRGCNGAPDFVIEILSPSNGNHDTFTKYYLYRSAGVREYWVIDPVNKSIQMHFFETNEYNIAVYGETEKVIPHVLEGCEIYLKDVFDI